MKSIVSALLVFAVVIRLNSAKSNVRTKCEVFQWKCKNGQCINREDLCNGVVSCSDSSDETHQLCARQTCPPYMTKCAYGACVNFNAKCNGIKDCADNSDEENCDPVEVPIKRKRGFCSVRDFRCRRGECIRNEQLCDGKQDCSNGSDETEELCSLEVCPTDKFQCKYGACVPGRATCNGLKDCADGSDETVELCGPPESAPSTQGLVDDAVTPRIVPPKTDSRSCQVILNDPNIWAVDLINTSHIINNGDIISEHHQIEYRCMEPYFLYGSYFTRNYCKDGTWLYPISKCSMGCPPEVINGVTFSRKCTLDNSEAPCNGRIQPNTRVDISCSTGYRKPYQDVPETINCLETGEWDYHPTSCEPVCGKLTDSVTPSITGEDTVNIKEVPWHAAIYKSVGRGKFDQICGGTIYSAKLVISAAHCFWNFRTDKPDRTGLFRVAVGKVYRDYNANEPLLKQFFNVSEIHIPVTYRGADRSYENDIAILVLSNYISYRDYIKPICIRLFKNSNRELKPGSIGRIAGWGETNIKDQYGEVLKAVDLPAFSKEQCLKENSTFKPYITGKKFCVGAPNDESVSEGDSGGGYVVKDQNTGIYYLWGVLSVGLGRTSERDHLKTFTNIQYHKKMITDYEMRYRLK